MSIVQLKRAGRVRTIETKETETGGASVTVFCTVTGSGLGSDEEVVCEEEVKTCEIERLVANGIAVRSPVAGKTVGTTGKAPLVEEKVASREETVPRGPLGKGWVLTA